MSSNYNLADFIDLLKKSNCSLDSIDEFKKINYINFDQVDLENLILDVYSVLSYNGYDRNDIVQYITWNIRSDMINNIEISDDIDCLFESLTLLNLDFNNYYDSNFPYDDTILNEVINYLNKDSKTKYLLNDIVSKLIDDQSAVYNRLQLSTHILHYLKQAKNDVNVFFIKSTTPIINNRLDEVKDSMSLLGKNNSDSYQLLIEYKKLNELINSSLFRMRRIPYCLL